MHVIGLLIATNIGRALKESRLFPVKLPSKKKKTRKEKAAMCPLPGVDLNNEGWCSIIQNVPSPCPPSKAYTERKKKATILFMKEERGGTEEKGEGPRWDKNAELQPT